jgi:hypothetical protein
MSFPDQHELLTPTWIERASPLKLWLLCTAVLVVCAISVTLVLRAVLG